MEEGGLDSLPCFQSALLFPSSVTVHRPLLWCVGTGITLDRCPTDANEKIHNTVEDRMQPELCEEEVTRGDRG